MNIIGIIPARMGSTRFPGKPLADLHGMPMLGHVYYRSAMSQVLQKVYIATCDSDIQEYAKSIAAPCIMTDASHERCSDRAAEAMLKIEAETNQAVDIVVMIQGDEPMVTPAMLDDAVTPLLDNLNDAKRTFSIVNLMAEITNEQEFYDTNEIKVVIDQASCALYFSRNAIPASAKYAQDFKKYKQVCVIPFYRDYLLHFNQLKPTPLEKIESVDMLRIVENGGKVKMVMSKTVTKSVDTPADLKEVAKLMNDDKLIQHYAKVTNTV